jgi:hypothetical protein
MDTPGFLTFATTKGVTFHERDGKLMAKTAHDSARAWVQRAKEEISKRKEEILACLIRVWRWRVRLPDQVLIAHILPEATHAEVLAIYPEAVSIETFIPKDATVAVPEKHECRTCEHLRKPGLSDGYCSGRDDLPRAYGKHHPLRECPADGGASCAMWGMK